MIYTFGECVLDTQLHVLSRAEQPVKLRPKAFEVLVYLLEHRDRIVTKHELCEQVWANQFISDATLGSTVRAVRRAIVDTGEAHQFIRTVHGYGYRCLAPVKVCSAPQAASVPTAEWRGVRTPPLLVPEAEAAGLPTLQALPPSLPPPVLSAGERKVVTVLCCAPVLPTTDYASDDLDVIYSLMQAFYTCVQDTVQQYGGTLQPPMGDRAVAVFGAPLAQEDHVMRAGLAALALLQLLDEEPCPAGPSVNVRLAVRIGAVYTRDAWWSEDSVRCQHASLHWWVTSPPRLSPSRSTPRRGPSSAVRPRPACSRGDSTAPPSGLFHGRGRRLRRRLTRSTRIVCIVHQADCLEDAC